MVFNILFDDKLFKPFYRLLLGKNLLSYSQDGRPFLDWTGAQVSTYRENRMMQSQWPEDVRRFSGQLKMNLGGVFSPKREILIARAPARLDIMAGLSDYAGATVLSTPLQAATVVAVQKRLDRRFVIRNLDMNKERVINCEYRLDDLFEAGQLKPYSVLQGQFSQDPHHHWLSHVIGAIPVLLQEGFAKTWDSGANIAISSTIPMAAAVASSAALQVANLLALTAAFGLSLDGFQVALASQILENQIVGTPAGITHHVAVALGQSNRTMVLRCQPHELVKMLSLPATLQWVGIASGVTLAHKESRFRDLRIASFMGRKIIQQNILSRSDSLDQIRYLCNIDMGEWEKKYSKMVLAKILGKEFVKRYASHDDPATKINPEKRYAPRGAAEHHLLENKRSERLVHLLETANEENLLEAGWLMYESHQSYQERCGMGCKETDLLVNLIKAQGPEKGFYGAKSTGWGCGGTIVVLAARGTEDLLHNLASQYHDLTRYEPQLFFNSSLGAMEMGVIRVAFD